MLKEHIKLFPTSIFTFELNDNKNSEWFDYILKNSRDTGTMVQTEANLQEQDLFKDLVDCIISTTKEINQILGYDPDYVVDITSMWGQILKPGNVFHPHTHSNNFWSGAYYVASPKENNLNTIQFIDPRQQTHIMTPSKIESKIENAPKYRRNQPPGTGVIFPSWLQHWVPTVNDKGRCSISWNILLRGYYDTKDSKQWSKI